MDDLQYKVSFKYFYKSVKWVLNLVINGWPSIPLVKTFFSHRFQTVLNLVINGWPSIPLPKGWMLYLC